MRYSAWECVIGAAFLIHAASVPSLVGTPCHFRIFRCTYSCIVYTCGWTAWRGPWFKLSWHPPLPGQTVLTVYHNSLPACGHDVRKVQ